MRDPKRIDEALKILGHYWKKHPDLRLGQLLCNVTEDGLEDSSKLYYVEDEYLMIAIMMRYGSVEDKEGFKESMKRVLAMFGDTRDAGDAGKDKKKVEDKKPGEPRGPRSTDKDYKDCKDCKDCKEDKDYEDYIECIFHIEDIPPYYTYNRKKKQK